MENKMYYISLTRGLIGYYVKVAATSEEVARQYAQNYYAHNWCSVYTSEDMLGLMMRYPTNIINDDPILLNDCPEYV